MASKRARRRKLYRCMCEGKKKYVSKEIASSKAYKYFKIFGGKRLTPYKCRFCHYWHLGHRKY